MNYGYYRANGVHTHKIVLSNQLIAFELVDKLRFISCTNCIDSQLQIAGILESIKG